MTQMRLQHTQRAWSVGYARVRAVLRNIVTTVLPSSLISYLLVMATLSANGRENKLFQSTSSVCTSCGRIAHDRRSLQGAGLANGENLLSVEKPRQELLDFSLEDALARMFPVGLRLPGRTQPENQTVLIFATANAGYLDFLENWYASVRKQGRGESVLFVAEDATALEYLAEFYPGRVVFFTHMLPWEEEGGEGEEEGGVEGGSGRDGPERQQQQEEEKQDAQLGKKGGDGALEYKSAQYGQLVDRRPLYFQRLLSLNRTFLYNDVDMVWLGDPVPLLLFPPPPSNSSSPPPPPYDMLLTEDSMRDKGDRLSPQDDSPVDPLPNHNLCTCLMFVRATSASMMLVEKWRDTILDQLLKHPGEPVMNQPAFNTALTKLGGHVRVGNLPQRLFPSGELYFRNRQWQARMSSSGVRPLVVHNNWLVGHEAKEHRFKRFKLWHLENGSNHRVYTWAEQRIKSRGEATEGA